MTDAESPMVVPLEDAPIGLFMSEGELCLKTEYVREDGAIDAYIVSSGEAFWGPQPQTVEHQRKCLVVPFDLAAALARLEAAERALEAIARLASCEGHPPFYSEACDRLFEIGKSALTALAREEAPHE